MSTLAKWRASFSKPQSFKHLLTMVLFPGVTYWGALFYHVVLGGFLYALVAAIFGFRGDFVGPFHYWQAFAATAAVIGVGFLVFGWNHSSTLLGREHRNYLNK